MDTQAQTPPADVDILAELVALRTEVVFMRQELVAIKHLLKAEPESTLDPESMINRFAGMWSDFDEEDEAIFESILRERGHYFADRPLESAE